MMTLALDSSPVGLLLSPGYSAEAAACEEWAERMVDAGYRVAVLEIIIYEIRRELLRLDKRKSLLTCALPMPHGRDARATWHGRPAHEALTVRGSIVRLADLKSRFAFLPLDSLIMDKAAEFWAESRRRGRPTASEKALDVDVILAAQAWRTTYDGSFVVIATTNRKHLSQFVPAEHWKDIRQF